MSVNAEQVFAPTSSRGNARPLQPYNPNVQRKGTNVNDPDQPARENWNRYGYVKQRGHVIYCEQAKRNEQMWLGAGLQWLDADRDYIENVQKTKAFEINEIFDAINTACGYQLNNRLDISYRPRGQGASEEIAKTLSQVAMQVADNNKLKWHESQVFSDGIIQQRGYFEVRMNFDDSMRGEIKVTTLDPMDVIPDPDAKSYDPDEWADVMITRWLTLDEVEGLYGSEARAAVENRYPNLNERDFGYDLNEVDRAKFGPEYMGASPVWDAYYTEGGITHVRIVDRQRWMMTRTRVVIYPTGDIRNAEHATSAQLAAFRQSGCIIVNRPQRRVRWTVSTSDMLLHDDWSPYNHFTVVPFFPFFRRGQTRGLVDNAISPQELLNKMATKEAQIVSSAANSGWLIEQNSLTGNIDTDDLENQGSRNGLVLEYMKGAMPPKKIEPNGVPSGIDHLLTTASDKIKQTMGNPDSMKGQRGAQQSGIAVQAQQYGDQMSLAVPLDNLSRTRHMMAERFLELIQGFYDDARLMRITQTDPRNGRVGTKEIQLNWQDQVSGAVLNDLTVGEYDVVVTEQPAQVTFENSQYNQALEMKKAGIAIPDAVVLRYSALADKSEIIDQIANQPAQSNPLDDAKATLAQAQAALAKANAVNSSVQALFSAIRTGQIIAAMPQVAGLADTIARSAGFQDADAGPIYPDEGAAAQAGSEAPTPAPPTNTDPRTPDHADRGAATGINGGQTPPGGQ